MAQSQRFATSLIILLVFISLLPTAAFSADSDRQVLEEWVESNNFLDYSIEDRLVLLEKLSRQNFGENIFVASMNSFKSEVAVQICEIDTRKLDLKTFLEKLNMSRKLAFHVSEKVKITSDMIFQNCTLLAMVGRLCSKYQLKAFYYAGGIYLLPGTKANID
ncbi:MAG: hypothetical protein CVV41_14190 [Candidatus Riflebacteria bacterium HGW-Riflebacteria-1]|nr:MAG: hypothetical protein CVV41_14190 [Candidatus Riflebacteria bacterium HGW-Riflebacteria-1]